jgi:hypothetical protein
LPYIQKRSSDVCGALVVGGVHHGVDHRRWRLRNLLGFGLGFLCRLSALCRGNLRGASENEIDVIIGSVSNRGNRLWRRRWCAASNCWAWLQFCVIRTLSLGAVGAKRGDNSTNGWYQTLGQIWGELVDLCRDVSRSTFGSEGGQKCISGPTDVWLILVDGSGEELRESFQMLWARGFAILPEYEKASNKEGLQNAPSWPGCIGEVLER